MSLVDAKPLLSMSRSNLHSLGDVEWGSSILDHFFFSKSYWNVVTIRIRVGSGMNMGLVTVQSNMKMAANAGAGFFFTPLKQQSTIYLNPKPHFFLSL
uniref:Uncharacterized protein n=1 Tax=Solanum lycopersicum TaxID=4081 RepID=A0A3Q7GDQ6_SOLLC